MAIRSGGGRTVPLAKCVKGKWDDGAGRLNLVRLAAVGLTDLAARQACYLTEPGRTGKHSIRAAGVNRQLLLAVLGKFGSQLIELVRALSLYLGSFALCLFCLALRFFRLALCLLEFGIFPDTLLQRLRGMRAVRIRHVIRLFAIQIESGGCLFHRFQIPQGIGMNTERHTQGLAIQFRRPCQQLLVDTDRQRQAVAENRKLFLQLLEQRTRCLRRGRC